MKSFYFGWIEHFNFVSFVEKKTDNKISVELIERMTVFWSIIWPAFRRIQHSHINSLTVSIVIIKWTTIHQSQFSFGIYLK